MRHVNGATEKFPGFSEFFGIFIQKIQAGTETGDSLSDFHTAEQADDGMTFFGRAAAAEHHKACCNTKIRIHKAHVWLRFFHFFSLSSLDSFVAFAKKKSFIR